MRLFTRDKSFYRMLIALAIPVALQNLITFGVNFADNLMVSELGDTAVSGVYVANQIQTFLQLFTAGIEAALLVLATQYWGRGETGQIKRIAAIGLQCAAGVGLLVTALCLILPATILSLFTNETAVVECGVGYLRIVCLSYLLFCVTQVLIATMRSVEVARIGLVVSTVSLISNVCLNRLFIFGAIGLPAMGARGAALATLLSRVLELGVILVYVLRIDRRLGIRLRELLVTDPVLLRDFVRCALPLVAGQVVWGVNLMTNSAILGRFGEEVITAASVANTMNSLAYVAMMGMAAAVGIITGKTVGEGKFELMKEYAKTVQLLFLILGLFTGASIFLTRRPFVALYDGISAEAAEQAVIFITVLSVSMIGSCYQAACLMGLVKSGGDVSFVFKNDMIFVFLVVLPSAILAAWLGAAPWVVFACLKCDQILKCFVALVKINRYDWMKKLVREADS